MSKIRKYARNLLANWFGYGLNLVVMFLLSPFVVHRLGNNAYGVWSLLVSITGYLGLIEMGTRGGLDRFINFYLGKDDLPSVNSVVNTGIAIFVFCGLILMLIACIISGAFHTFFSKTPMELVGAARIAIFLIAINLWLSFLGVPFFQILTAFERFDILNGINISVLLVRTVWTVTVLLRGGGIIQLAVVQALATLCGIMTAYVLAKRIFPQLRLTPVMISLAHFRELFTFSFWAFVGNVSMQLLYYTDNVLVAYFFGPEMVTFYSIGGMLIIYGRGIIGQCSSIFVPQIIKDVARKDWPALHRLFQQGSMLTMAVGILLLIGMVVFGREFISLWMGPEYAHKSYGVMLILTISQFPAIAALLCSSIILGLNKVKYASVVTFLQAVVNLLLSIFFVKYCQMGIEGVAWGTFYPRIIFTLFIGFVVLRWIDLPISVVFKNLIFRWVLSSLIFMGICLAILRLGAPVDRWNVFIVKIILALAAYLPLAWFFLVSKNERGRLLVVVKNTLRGESFESA